MTDIASSEPTDITTPKRRGPAKGTPNESARLKAEARRELQAARRERYRAQEAKRAPRIQIDQKATLGSSLALAIIALITSGVISFNGITSVAPLVGLSFDWQAYMFFGFIEGLIVYFTLNFLIRSSRVDDRPRGDFAGLIVFSGVALLANAYHTLIFHDWAWQSADTWAGVVLSIMAPVAVIWVTKSSSATLFARALHEEDAL